MLATLMVAPMDKPIRPSDSVPRSRFRIAERRQTERYPADVQVKFRKYCRSDLSKCDGIFYNGWIRNISLGGMLLESEIYLDKEQEVEIYASERSSGPFYAVVETMRVKKLQDFYEVGVRIISKEVI